MPEKTRFVDTRETLAEFTDEYLVVCPACAGCARVLPAGDARELFGRRRLVCSHCALVRESDVGSVAFGDAVDGYFGQPLWLAAPCCGETLWAHNPRHLEFLEQFVGAELREQERDPETGWSSRSLANRLPAWMKAAKNRTEILRAIRKLKERCPS